MATRTRMSGGGPARTKTDRGGAQRRAGNPGRSKTLYPLLERIAGAATDEWWREYLLGCAKSGLPKGVSLSGAVLSYAGPSGNKHYELSQDPRSAYDELCAFFALHSRVTPTLTTQQLTESASEAPKKERAEARARSSTSKRKKKAPGGWSTIKNKNRRLALLGRFVEVVSAEHGLGEEQCRELRHALFTADLEDMLDECVSMANGFIASVSCVVYDGETFSYRRPRPRVRRVIRVAPPPSGAFAGYPSKQLDPCALVDAHLKALRKQRQSTIVRKASEIVEAAAS
jgi:hypothetical protein